jgi:hypothetical protein
MSPTTADRYAAIERLYSLGQWQQVLDESEALLAGLTGNNASSLRQRLLLLQGHTRLHGLGQIDAASALYQQVLDSQPEPVLLAVAQQQLARAQTMTETADPAVEPAVEPAPREPTLLSQAFPFTAEAVGTAPPGQPAAAAPWLESSSQPAAAAPTPVEVIEVIEEPEQIAVHQADPDRAQIVDLAPWSPAEEAELARGLLEVVLR